MQDEILNIPEEIKYKVLKRCMMHNNHKIIDYKHGIIIAKAGNKWGKRVFYHVELDKYIELHIGNFKDEDNMLKYVYKRFLKGTVGDNGF